MAKSRRSRLKVSEYKEGILLNDRMVLSKAITLIESALSSDRVLADALITQLMPHTGRSLRIGITGVPGVGKSTFIESFGAYLIEQGLRVAVLAIDPSSQKTGGSILGDKTRMEALSHNKNAYIRPSATGSTLGGVADKTRESILLCEAAGYDVVLIETVGVGQSEVKVKSVVDYFLLLMLSGAGDELQGIKKGIMEMADGMAITKADGDNTQKATKAQGVYKAALHLFAAPESGVPVEVLTCSSLHNTGLAEIWQSIEGFKEQVKANGYFDLNRNNQQLSWMRENVNRLLMEDFERNHAVQHEMKTLEKEILEGLQDAGSAARKLMQVYKRDNSLK